MPSPLNCSRVIFTTRASNSALERFSQTLFRRRVRSFCTQSSLLSGLVPLASSEFSALHARALNNFSGNDILPHMAAEASPERQGRRWERSCLALLAPDSRNSQSKDAANSGLSELSHPRAGSLIEHQPVNLKTGSSCDSRAGFSHQPALPICLDREAVSRRYWRRPSLRQGAHESPFNCHCRAAG